MCSLSIYLCLHTQCKVISISINSQLINLLVMEYVKETRLRTDGEYGIDLFLALSEEPLGEKWTWKKKN